MAEQDIYDQDGNPAYLKTPHASEAALRFRPFDIWDGVRCTALQWRSEDWRARARRGLLVRQSRYIEFELWTGTIATIAGFPNDFLTNNPTLLNGGASLGYLRALAELEQANYTVTGGQPAMIHAMPRLVSMWLSEGMVTPNASGRQLRTGLGTIVVPGAGYPGTGDSINPGDSTVDASYAYITGLVQVRLGPVREIQLEGAGTNADADFNPDKNDFAVRVERPVLYSFDPCLKHGVLVNHTTEHQTVAS